MHDWLRSGYVPYPQDSYRSPPYLRDLKCPSDARRRWVRLPHSSAGLPGAGGVSRRAGTWRLAMSAARCPPDGASKPAGVHSQSTGESRSLRMAGYGISTRNCTSGLYQFLGCRAVPTSPTCIAVWCRHHRLVSVVRSVTDGLTDDRGASAPTWRKECLHWPVLQASTTCHPREFLDSLSRPRTMVINL